MSRVTIVASVYIALALTGLIVARAASLSSTVWPAAGWGLAAVLLWRSRGWVGVAIGAGVANLLWVVLVHGGPLYLAIPMAAGIGVGNGMEALYGGWLLRERDHRFHPAIWFGLTVIACCCVASVVGVTVQMVGGTADVYEVPRLWWTWWAGDAIGILLCGPLLRHLW